MKNRDHMSEEIIQLSNVQKTYRTKFYQVHALRDVNMSIYKGEYVAIMGPSGSGKSTLLCILGCLDKATKGNVLIDGINVTRMSERRLTNLRRDKIGFIFQQYNLIPTLTAKENIELPMIFKGISKRKRLKRAEELLRLVGLKREIHRKPQEMSGGQQQRVAVARALANKPSILLCDEPTGNLDSKTGTAVMKIIRDLNQQEGVTVILVTHDQSHAEFADRSLGIIDGEVNVS